MFKNDITFLLYIFFLLAVFFLSWFKRKVSAKKNTLQEKRPKKKFQNKMKMEIRLLKQSAL